MHAELDAHAEAHEQDADVGEDPARIAHDLKNRGRVLIGKGGLIEGEPLVAERVVHVDERHLVLGVVLVIDHDFTGEIEGNLGAWVFVVLEIDQVDREWIVETRES